MTSLEPRALLTVGATLWSTIPTSRVCQQLITTRVEGSWQ